MSDNQSTGALDDLIGSLKSAVAPFRNTLQELHAKYRDVNDGKVADYIPGAGAGRPELVWHLGRHSRRPGVRRRRLPAAVQHSVGVEAVRVRHGAGGSWARGRAEEGRRRADRRGVQRDRARRAVEPAVQSAGERRGDRHGRPHSGQGFCRPDQAAAGHVRPLRRPRRCTSTTRFSCPSGRPVIATARSPT